MNYYYYLMIYDIIVSWSFVPNKSANHEYAIYLNLLWFIHKHDEIPDVLISQYFTTLYLKKDNDIMLKSPESLWLIGIKNLNEREKWIETLMKTMNIDSENLQRGYRYGKHYFSFHLNSYYEGEWMESYMDNVYIK